MTRFEKAVFNLTQVVIDFTRDKDFKISETTTNNYIKFRKESYPFNISLEGCKNTIYGNEYVNVLARVWHDWYHYKHNLNFTEESEITVYGHQREDIWKYMLGNNSGQDVSDAILLLKIDIIEQFKYYKETGKFVENQYEFVKKIFEERIN